MPTASGRRLLERAAPAHLAGVRGRFVDLLTPDEQDFLAAAFAKIRTATEARDDA